MPKPSTPTLPPRTTPTPLTHNGCRPDPAPAVPNPNRNPNRSPSPSPPSHPTSDIPHPTSLDFNPSPSQSDAILDSLSDPETSLGETARAHDISVNALTLWMARPDIAERLNALESAFARRAHLTLANRSAAVISAITRVLDEYQYSESHLLYQTSDLRAQELVRRNRETVLRATHYYLRLCRYFSPHQPPPTRKPAPPTPGISESGGGASESRGCQCHCAPTSPPLPTPTSHIPHPTSDIPPEARAARFPDTLETPDSSQGGTGGSPASDALQNHNTTIHSPTPNPPILPQNKPPTPTLPSRPNPNPAPNPPLSSFSPLLTPGPSP